MVLQRPATLVVRAYRRLRPRPLRAALYKAPRRVLGALIGEDGTVNREEWLEALGRALDHEFGLHCDAVCSVGFPKGARGKAKAIGQCWPNERSADGKNQIFISPVLEDAAQVAHVMLHERIHAFVGCKAGHKGEFVRVAKQVGLVKPWTATTPSEACAERLNALLATLEPYPHAKLSEIATLKPGSRLLLLECACGIKVRMAAKTYEDAKPLYHGEECELVLKSKGG